MPQNQGVDRRAFLRNAGLTAIAGAVGTSGATATTTAAPEARDVFDFDEIYDRVGTHCSRWDREIDKYGKENIEVALGIADMDFRSAPCITKALAERCKHENWGYLWTPVPSYTEAIVEWNKRRYGLEIDPDTVKYSNGVHNGLIAALQAFAPPGSKVLLLTPTYDGFYTDLRYTHTLPAPSLMNLENGRYSIAFDDLESRISADTHTLILCNPQNPTGNVWSKEDLMRIGELCLERRIVVLSDEIHCDFVMNGQKYTPFASLPDKDVVDNSITFKAASKSFNLPSMKSAWYFSTNADYLAKVVAHNRDNLNTLGMVANEAALREGDAWFDQVLAYIEANHDFAEAYIRDNIPLIDFKKPQGTYLAWLDVSKVVEKVGAKQKAAEESKSSETPVTAEKYLERWFVENAKVFMNPGSNYGTGGEGHMRMNLASPRKLIERALDNMAEALHKV